MRNEKEGIIISINECTWIGYKFGFVSNVLELSLSVVSILLIDNATVCLENSCWWISKFSKWCYPKFTNAWGPQCKLKKPIHKIELLKTH